jgi:NHLM bacteriocin system ABC transporter ATP-binding protein
MNEPLLTRPEAATTLEPPAVQAAERMTLDARQPLLLDRRGRVMRVLSGHVDLFAVSLSGGKADTARQHLVRIETGEVFADLLDRVDTLQMRLMAVGGSGSEVMVVGHGDCDDDAIDAWLIKLSKLIAGPHPSWDINEATGRAEMAPGERRRGPARHILWVSVASGEAHLMGQEPGYVAGGPRIPLTSGMWMSAGPSACTLDVNSRPTGTALWDALDQFHRRAAACVRERLRQIAELESERLVRRTGLTKSRAMDMFGRLSTIIVRRSDHVEAAVDVSDPLLAACRIATDDIDAPIAAPSARLPAQQAFTDLIEIARASRLRVRRVQLRGDWWTRDSGGLVGWYGAAKEPVALVRRARRTIMIAPGTGTRRQVDSALAREIAPEAATFYPTLPSSGLKLRNLLVFALRHVHGDIARIALAVTFIGLLSMVTPLITQALVNSVIPRTEIDQLVFCALALAVSAVSMAGVQLLEGTAMLRMEGLTDWRLQAAVIDRLLKLPASLFREYTVGDFVSRAMGIDAIRRILTGQTLRSLMAGLFCFYSILLMLIYDIRLALIALGLIFVRALLIIGTSALRIYHETRQFNLQGKLEGFVLQLLAGVGKLRVAAATVRALAVWSQQFAAQKRHFIGSQRAGNALSVFESAYPTIATLLLFASAVSTESALMTNLGAFLAFLAAFGQAMAGIGLWASGVSASLIAIPYVIRIKPLITAAAEIADDRKPPGELTGAVEFSRVTFRYLAGGPPVVDNLSLRIAPGEYVAIVGPSGSGKSTLFRMLLGFEKPESGVVFFDGKALDTLDVSAVRRQLGVVLQNGKLVTGSIYENISGGLPLSLDQAWAAARMSGLADDIETMPMGMHTAIAEGINTLSGGQRQRIMIARAVARRPRILLFDEATSSLDNRSQAVVSDSLGALNVTRIVIAHRLSTVREADRIVVMDSGKIVQTGTFAELAEVKGIFADFAQRQLL